jgi:UDP-N-acetyl-D-mannosaminuronate dehydrogenase
VVLGIGFVGTVMAVVIADSTGISGKACKFMFVVLRASSRSYWRILILNRGESPIMAEDHLVEQLIQRCVIERRNLVATHREDVLRLTDVVVVDVQCDYRKRKVGNVRSGVVDMKALENFVRTIARNINPETLVLIETTVPPGTTE